MDIADDGVGSGTDDVESIDSGDSTDCRGAGVSGPPHHRRRSGIRARRRGERGTTLVEYALLVALIAIPTISAINALQDASKVTIEDTAARMSTRAAPGDGG